MSSAATSDAPSEAADACRCLCGSMLARLVDGGVELKCRRCKRTTWLPLAEMAHEGPPTNASPTPRPEALSPESFPSRPAERRRPGKDKPWLASESSR